jgi:hypothetical protein
VHGDMHTSIMMSLGSKEGLSPFVKKNELSHEIVVNYN